MRPQFGSPPNQLVLTSELFATARRGICIGERFRAGNPDGHKPVHAFAVPHNHLGELEANVIQRGLEDLKSWVGFGGARDVGGQRFPPGHWRR